MSDAPSSPEAAAPVVTKKEVKATVAEVLVHGTDQKTGKIKPEQQVIVDDARKHQLEGRGIDSIGDLTGATTEKRFSQLQGKALAEKFGGGKITFNNETKLFVYPTEMPTPERASFDSAVNSITNLTNLLSSMEVTAAIESGKGFDDAIKAWGEEQISKEEFGKRKDDAIDYVIAHSGSLFTENALKENGNPMRGNELRKFVEATMAKDPVFRNKIAGRLKDIASQAENMPKVESDEEVKTAKNTIASENQNINTLKKQLEIPLGDIGLDINDPEINGLIESLSTGQSANSIAEKLARLAWDQDDIGAQNSHGFAEYEKALKEYSAAGGDLKEIALTARTAQNQAGRRQGQAPQQAAPTEATPTTPLGIYNEARANALAKVTKLKEEIIDTNPDAYVKYQKIREYLTDRNSEGIREGELSGRFALINRASNEISNANKLLERKQKDSEEKERTTRTARLIKERELNDMLEGIVPNALADTISEKYDKVNGALAEVRKKREEKAMTADEKILNGKMDKNWIELKFDGKKKREKIPHNENIKSDVRLLSYEGDRGLDRMFLRDLGWTYKDGENEVPITKENYMTIDVDAVLSDEQKQKLKDIKSKMGEKYVSKLLIDFNMARTLGSRLKDNLPGTDKMGLNNYEWQNLQKNYGPQLEASWNKSEDYKKVNSILEANGVKPDFKTKSWIYSLVAILGIGALATFGIIPTVTAGAAVAKGVGGMALHGAA